MKTTRIGAALAAIIAIATGLSAQAQSLDTLQVDSKGPLTIKWYSASLPREDTTLVSQGASWPAAASNWMTAIRTEAATVGIGHEQAKSITFNDYEGMVTSTTFNSWRASTVGAAGEYGNRQHYGFKLSCQTGSFIPANTTYTLTTYKWEGSWVSYSTVSPSMALDNNTFRQRINVDGTVAANQTMSLATSGFIYGGYGFGVPAYGSGENSAKLQNALDWLTSKKLRVDISVTVPHSSGTTYTFSNTYMPPTLDPTQLQVRYVKNPVLGISRGLQWASPAGGLYQVFKSPNLVAWTPVGMATSSGAGIINFAVTDEPGEGAPRMFYRIRGW